MTIPSHHRWKEFHFEIDSDFSGWQFVFCAVEFALRGMYLPALELLAATFPDPAEEFDEPMPLEYSFLNSLAFYESWVTPKLRTLTSINAIPYSSAGQTLTTCKIEVTTYDRYHAALSPLLYFLTCSRKLKKLDIHLGRGIFRIDKDGLERLPGIINLAELDHFGIVINCCNPDHVFHTFMRQILLPRVSKMFVYLNHREAVDIDNWIGALFITNKRYPSLRTLNIQNYLRPREENKSFPLQMILERIPHLHRLSITSPHIGLPESIQGITFPPLHTLTVIECKDLQIGSIKQLSSSLQFDTRRWAVFEKLTIARCQGIQKEELVDVFPQDKLHFHPA
ncbi:hypothetical protein DFH11DRAFT_1568128 [Phellopilus nigrolimitatus]|nr:hypothetical protein DFH11DRAFT_1568128 [Phellopilus nigrolimitatus]